MKERGQILVEYGGMLAICGFVALILMILFGVLSGYGRNLLILVGIDAP